MAEIDLKEFQERLRRQECSQTIRDVVDFLMKAAERAGPTEWRAHSTPGGGWGITGKRGKRVFCKFDPKPQVPHVGADVPGASESELMRAGRLHRRKDARPWVDIEDMRGAKVLEPLIARAYAAASSTTDKIASR